MRDPIVVGRLVKKSPLECKDGTAICRLQALSAKERTIAA